MSDAISYPAGIMEMVDGQLAIHTAGLSEGRGNVQSTGQALVGNAQGQWPVTFGSANLDLLGKLDRLTDAVHQVRTRAAQAHTSFQTTDRTVARTFGG
jgi:hypothetical protein